MTHRLTIMNTQSEPFEERAEDVCAREPIERPGTIQPHGVLLAVDPSLNRIVVASADATNLLGADPPCAAPATVLSADFAAERAARALRQRLAELEAENAALNAELASRGDH